MATEIKNLYVRLKRYIARYLNRPEDVEDLTQEAFLRVLEASSKGKIENPKAYLYRTAHNLALNSLARKSNHLLCYIEDLADSNVIEKGVPLEDQVNFQKNFELFCHATLELPERCREVLILRKVYGLSQKQVAQKLNISVSTVEKHLAKGISRCAASLESWESDGVPDRYKTCSSRQHKS